MKDPAIFAAKMKAKGFILTPHGWVKDPRLTFPSILSIYILPYPPVLNHYYVHTKRGVFLSAKGKAYKEDVRCSLFVQSPQLEILQGNLKLSVTLFRPRKTGDIDGPIKALLDSLQGLLYGNDKQIEELHIYRRDDKDRPRVEVSLKKL